MSEITDKVAELEAKEAEVKQKQEVLEKTNLEVEEKTKQKSALDAELARVQQQIEEARKARGTSESSFQDQMRGENLVSASKKFFGEVGIEKPEDQAAFLDSFKGSKPTGVTVDVLVSAMRAKYAAEHADELLAAKAHERELEKGAADFAAMGSSSGSAGASFAAPSASDDALDAADIAAARWSGIPLEKYKELKKKGLLD